MWDMGENLIWLLIWLLILRLLSGKKIAGFFIFFIFYFFIFFLFLLFFILFFLFFFFFFFFCFFFCFLFFVFCFLFDFLLNHPILSFPSPLTKTFLKSVRFCTWDIPSEEIINVNFYLTERTFFIICFDVLRFVLLFFLFSSSLFFRFLLLPLYLFSLLKIRSGFNFRESNFG